MKHFKQTFKAPVLKILQLTLKNALEKEINEGGHHPDSISVLRTAIDGITKSQNKEDMLNIAKGVYNFGLYMKVFDSPGAGDNSDFSAFLEKVNFLEIYDDEDEDNLVEGTTVRQLWLLGQQGILISPTKLQSIFLHLQKTLKTCLSNKEFSKDVFDKYNNNNNNNNNKDDDNDPPAVNAP